MYRLSAVETVNGDRLLLGAFGDKCSSSWNAVDGRPTDEEEELQVRPPIWEWLAWTSSSFDDSILHYNLVR
jgi:hypothetical protein